MNPLRPFRLPLVSGGLALLALPLLLATGALREGDPTPTIPEIGALQESPAEAEADDSRARGPGRRRAIGGLAGVWCVSTLTLNAFPDRPQRVEMTYVFPDRVRWRMAPVQKGDDGLRRRIWYRWGAEFWRVEAKTERSVPPPPEERTLNLLQMELRRVALIWPADLEWRGSATAKRAEVKGLGELRAELDEKTGRPSALEFRVGEGGDRPPDERLEGIRWREWKGRAWPTSWTVVVGKKAVATEVIGEIRPGARYLDSYFQPLDRRDLRGSVATPEPGEVRLTPRVVRRTPLKAGTGWKSAFQAADEELARWRKELESTPWELSPRAAFQLDGKGRPKAVELRLAGEPEGKPEGWERIEGGEGLSVLLEGLDGVNAAFLTELNALVPAGRRAQTPYVRVQRKAEGEVGLVQLVLPIVAAE